MIKPFLSISSRSSLQTLPCSRQLLTLILVAVCSLAFAMSDSLEAQVASVPRDTLPTTLDPQRVPVGFNTAPEAPQNNPTSDLKVTLGRELFFDPILSVDRTVACATCHRPEHGFASPDPIAIGVKGRKGTRNAPSVINAAYASSLTWDGRDASLEAQVLGPLTNEAELGGDVEKVIEQLKADPNYPKKFATAFKVKPDEAVTTDHLAKAIASFERTLVAGDNEVDKFRRQDYSALSKSARTGMWLFESRGGCWKCHSGPNMSDDQFHNTGVSFGTKDRDLGRMAVTKDAQHRFQFRTPSLRNVELTAPYMHDGSIKTLREVVEFYNRGGAPKDPQLDTKLKPLGLSDDEVGHLVEFLKSLTGDRLDQPAGDSAD